jgi:hypothetical protein
MLPVRATREYSRIQGYGVPEVRILHVGRYPKNNRAPASSTLRCQPISSAGRVDTFRRESRQLAEGAPTLAGSDGREEEPTGEWLRKRPRWARLALGACAVLAAIAAAAWFATPWYVRTSVLPSLWARYGLTVTAERQALSVADGVAEFHGVRILDGEEEILSASRMEVRVSLRGLYEGHTIFERIVLDDPVLHAHLEADGRTNIGRILGRRTDTTAEPRPATLWQELGVHRGTVEWDDRTRGVSLRIVDIEATVLEMQTGLGEPQNRFGQITIDASLEQPGRDPALLSIVYWATPSGSAGPTFVAHGTLTGIDLDSFPVYVDAIQRTSLGVDHLDLVVSMEVADGVIRRGAAVAISPERTRPLTLLFGGPFDDPVFDRSSRLAALWELPFSRLGRLGSVVWETGDAVVGGAVGIADGVVHGNLLGAGKSAVEGVSGGGVALGSNALDSLEDIGRALGLVAQEAARDTAAIHDRQRAVFLSARSEAAEAWSREHSEPGP